MNAAIKNLEKLKSILICPASKTLGNGELPLELDGNKLVCGDHSYPVYSSGVPNLRLPFDQGEFTSYDDILGDFSRGTTPAP